MKTIKVIQLIDGSTHQSKQSAERHLTNILSSGVCLELFEKLAKKNPLEIKQIFVDHEKSIVKTMQIVRELNEVFELKF